MTSQSPMSNSTRGLPTGPGSSAVQQQQQQQRSSPLRRNSPQLPVSPFLRDTPGEARDSPDMSQGRHATTPRLGGSRLRQELSNEFGTDLASNTASPQGTTPSRMTQQSDSLEAGAHDSPAPSQQSNHDPDNPPMPMPRRRLPLPHNVPSSRTPVQPPAPTKRDPRPKHYTMEVPSVAPKYAPGNKADPVFRDPFSRSLFSGNADFFPWNGSHHEDEWSSEAIQKGTWDRGSQNETSAARFLVMPALKQKTGLSALSTIFMGVLNQRRNGGQVTAPSTFKYPPRVTVTDSKRELWIKDLANSAIPLRRLSRTIPHGIRGRNLLDQCINKRVPTERAIWLAKCVGANEIRGFRRKGVNSAFAMAGELKWIREWTIVVEQFVESTVSAFSDSDWKQRVTYATRLATILFSEHLLDRDHYLDWIISSLETSPQSKIPMWIIIAQICWVDLLRSRKFGRRLVFALLGHLSTIHNDPDRDIVIQLSNQLSTLLNTLLTQHPENFIHPVLWLKHRETLISFLGTTVDPTFQQAYNEVDSRNARLTIASASSPPSGSHGLIKLLDSTLQNLVDPDLSAKCWDSQDNKQHIIQSVVEWATSFHRPGIGKVYVAAKLIRDWSTFRINSTSAILETLDTISPDEDDRKNMVYRLVTELTRSGHFSLPQYIQWLIARGNCHDASEIDPVTGPCASRLLVELPVYCLSEERKRDRANLLRRAANYNVIEEEHDINMALKCVSQTLGFSVLAEDDDDTEQGKPIPLRKLLAMIKSSGMALKSSLGSHLRDAIVGQVPSKLDSELSLGIFTSIRTILETIQDFSMLADILSVCSRLSSIELLATCVDTININLMVFFSLGRGEELFDCFLERLKIIGRDHGIIARPFLVALASLAAHIPSRDGVAKNLQQELVHSDKSNAIDACSPVSDNMVSQPSSVEGEFSEQIDRLLASGTSVDTPTMNRLFRNIIPRLEAGWSKLDDSRRVYASLLGRLRIFDSQHFDKLMADWMSHIRSLKERQQLSELLPLLLSLGCLSISTMLQTASPPPSALPTTAAAAAAGSSILAQGSATYLQDMLQLVVGKLPKSTPLSVDETYRFQTYQQSARSDHSEALLALIRHAFMEYSVLKTEGGHVTLPLDDTSFQAFVQVALRYLVVADSASVAEALKMKNLTPIASNLVRKVVGKLLIPGNDGSAKTTFDQVLSLANELTMPFCQLTLNLELSFGQVAATSADGGGDQGQSQFDVFAKAMDSAIDAKNIMWTSMLPCLSEDITQHLKSQAHSRFLHLIPSSKSDTFTEEVLSEDRIQLAKNLLGVIEAIMSGQPPSKSGHLTTALVDKLTDLWEILSGSETTSSSTQSILENWLPVLLRFVSLHNGTLETTTSIATPSIAAVSKIIPTTSHEARTRIILVLCGILFELEAQFAEFTHLAQQVFDIALLLVDGLPDDLKNLCAKAIIANPSPTPSKTTTSDPRMYYLFSANPATLADNLMLAHRDKASLPHSAAARGLGAMYGIGPTTQEKFTPYMLRRWEVLSEPTPNVGENDTSLSLGLFEAIKIQ